MKNSAPKSQVVKDNVIRLEDFLRFMEQKQKEDAENEEKELRQAEAEKIRPWDTRYYQWCKENFLPIS